MEDFLDLALLKQFENNEERVEEPDPEDRRKMSPYQGTMTQLASMFSSEDELLQALEVEIFEKFIEEKSQASEK